MSGVTMSGFFGHGYRRHRVRSFRTRLDPGAVALAGGVGELLNAGGRVQDVAAGVVAAGAVVAGLLLQHEAVLAQASQVLGDGVLVETEIVGASPTISVSTRTPSPSTCDACASTASCCRRRPATCLL